MGDEGDGDRGGGGGGGGGAGDAGLGYALCKMVQTLSHMQQAMRAMELKLESTRAAVRGVARRMQAVEGKLGAIEGKLDAAAGRGADGGGGGRSLEPRPHVSHTSLTSLEWASARGEPSQSRCSLPSPLPPQPPPPPRVLWASRAPRSGPLAWESPSGHALTVQLLNGYPRTGRPAAPPRTPLAADLSFSPAPSPTTHAETASESNWPKIHASSQCAMTPPDFLTFPRPPPQPPPPPPPPKPSARLARTRARSGHLSRSAPRRNKRRAALGICLLKAAHDGDIREVRRLLEEGADPNFCNAAKWTPLHKAAVAGRPDAVSLLLEKRANCNARNAYGFTPLHLAAKHDLSGLCACFLMCACCNVNSKNHCGRTPLHYAAEVGNVAALRALLVAGARKDLRDKDGKTATELTKSVVVRRLLAPNCNMAKNARTSVQEPRWKI